jgi:hypothetical protein
MRKRQHIVYSRRRPTMPTTLPRDEWRGETFVESDGTELVVVASGRMPGPDWPEGGERSERTEAKISLHRGRA